MTDLLTWQVFIHRYVMVASTAKTVTILRSDGKEKRHPWKSNSGEFYTNPEDVKKAACRFLSQRRKVLEAYQDKLEKSEREIVGGKYRHIEPMDLSKIDSSKIKF